jgi:multidrug transporter EmrE-like cation transporter
MVSIRNTYAMIAVNILYTLSVITSIMLRYNDIAVNKWLQVLNEVVYVIPMIYLIAVLKYLKEDEGIATSYKIFTGIDIFMSLYYALIDLTVRNFGLYYLFFLLSIIAGIIFSIQSARMQNKWFANPMLTYGLIYLLVVVLQLIASVIYSSAMFKYVSFTELLIPAMMFYILSKIAKNVTNQLQPNTDYAQFGNNPDNI